MFTDFFEITLRENLSDKLQDPEYAQAMYAALCNTSWAYPALAPQGKDWVEVIRQNYNDNLAKTNKKWREIGRNLVDWIRRHITIPIGQKVINSVDDDGMKTRTIRFRPVFGKIDLFFMRLRFNSLLCPGWKRLDWTYGCSWRYAGGLIADLRNLALGTSEDYMNYYCSGSFEGVPEGTVTEEIEEDLNKLGWFKVPEEE